MRIWLTLRALWTALVLGFRDWKRKYSTKVAYAIMDSTTPAPPRVLPPPHLHLTAADRLDWLCRLKAAQYKILRFNYGCIVLLEMPDMNVHSSGIHETVAQCVGALYEKLGVST